MEHTARTAPRSWLIPGASSGLGSAFARAALGAGDLVTATARRSGTVVQVSSMMGLMSLAGAGAYCAAKGGLEQASEALAAEAGPPGIGALIVEPGVFRTGFFGPALRSSAAIADYDGTAGGTRAWLAAVHGTQPGDPDKAAQAVLAALDLPSPPLRLALGEDAVSAIRAKITAVSDDLDRNAPPSRSTDFAVAGTG